MEACEGPTQCVCAAHLAWCGSGEGLHEPLASLVPISAKASCMVLPTPSTMVGMEPWALGTPCGHCM